MSRVTVSLLWDGWANIHDDEDSVCPTVIPDNLAIEKICKNNWFLISFLYFESFSDIPDQCLLHYEREIHYKKIVSPKC